LLQDVEVGLQVRRVNRGADDGRVQVRVRESEAENELHRGHAVEQVIEMCPAPAIPLQPGLLPLGWRSLCRATANDDARAVLSGSSDRRFVFPLDRRVRDLEDIETPMAMWSLRWGNVPLRQVAASPRRFSPAASPDASQI
jgi:hypothetical protein